MSVGKGDKMRFFTVLFFICMTLQAQSEESISFEDYNPPSTLVVSENVTTHSKYPFVDVHNHQWDIPEQDLEELLADMDKLNMAVMVNLSGRSFRRTEKGFGHQGVDYLKASVDRIKKVAAGRIVTFTNVDFSELGSDDWTEKVLKQLETDAANGAAGLKIYKNLGMGLKDINSERVAIDDTRLDPVWAKCGELGIPVLIHSADPFQFWQEHDAQNERWLELKEKPGRKRDPASEPSFEQIINEQHNIFRKHPNTIFINAHLGWMCNNLAKLGRHFEEFPNVYTEIGAVLAELGRQPRTAREFFIKYQDRILFGKDSWRPEEYKVYFRVLETADEYFDYYRRRHAFWKMYGLDLPDEVLKKVYYKNAIRIVPGIDKTLFPD
jgi:predicted TIM-barrel fold metal-dependent hydrolase